MVLFELMFRQTRGVVYFFISQMNFLLFLFPTSIMGDWNLGFLIYIYNKLLRKVFDTKLGTKMAKCIFFLHEIGTRQETSRYLIVSTYTTTSTTLFYPSNTSYIVQ